MNAVFADTFYFVALLNGKDQAHQRAINWTVSYTGYLLTTEWVLAEFGNHMAHPRNRHELVSTVRDLRANTQVQIVAANSELFNNGLELFASRNDKHWSLTDCISFVVMSQFNLTAALTGDHHFEQAGFVALLK